MEDPVEQICAIFAREGRRRYGMEAVSQLEHALQCATHAEHEGAPPSLIVSSLVHDIGHLLNPDETEAILRGEDAHHEERGAAYLAQWFGEDVTEPVRLHVAAKRYLTARDRDYFQKLSMASRRTLELQGGPFTSDEGAAYLRTSGAEQALMVRRWDEKAKVVGASTPPLDHFRPYMQASLRPLPG